MAALLHSGDWQGPCRWKPPIPFEQERAGAKQTLEHLHKRNLAQLGPDAKVLSPVFLEYWEDFDLKESELKKLDADAPDVDIFLVSSNNTAATAGATIANRYEKPTVIVDGGADAVDLAGFMAGEGLESYLPADMEDFRRLLRLLKARKSLAQTRLLLVGDRKAPPVGGNSTIWDLDRIEDKFGLQTKWIALRELAQEMDRVLADAASQKQAEALADRLIAGAEKSWIDREYVVASCLFYRAVQNLMLQYNCNAFTIECFEFCVSRLPEKWKITPCLIHSLLKDRGFASACESDLSALITMHYLQAVADGSSFMGNLNFEDEQTIGIWHSVPGLKMVGYNEPDLVYQLGHFTPDGWGTKLQLCFAQPKDKRVTVARIDKQATALGVGVGEVVTTKNYDQGDLVGCRLRAMIKVPDARKFFSGFAPYGNHVVMVYGDHRESLQKLGKAVGLEVKAIA
jgi:L-fucose isomerase-like protein